MKTIKLRKDNLEMILGLEELCFPTEKWKKEDWIDLLTDERATYYAFMDGEKLVGNVFTYNWQGEKDYVKIMNLSVHPEYRKKGLAHKLMDLVYEEMQASNLKKICAETRASNKKMQKVFHDCGYSLNTIEEKCYANPEEAGYKYVLKR